MSEYDSIDSYDIENVQSKNNLINKKRKFKIICKLILIAILFITIIMYFIYNEYVDINISISVNSTYLPFAKLPIDDHKKTCDDYEYGCCEVIDNDNNKYTLSFNRIHKNDKNGTNCPTFNRLINNYIEYEEYYTYNIINCIYNKCCEEYDIIIPLENCPSSYDIVNEFNNNYEDPYNTVYTICIILIYICVMYNIITC